MDYNWKNDPIFDIDSNDMSDPLNRMIKEQKERKLKQRLEEQKKEKLEREKELELVREEQRKRTALEEEAEKMFGKIESEHESQNQEPSDSFDTYRDAKYLNGPMEMPSFNDWTESELEEQRLLKEEEMRERQEEEAKKQKEREEEEKRIAALPPKEKFWELWKIEHRNQRAERGKRIQDHPLTRKKAQKYFDNDGELYFIHCKNQKKTVYFETGRYIDPVPHWKKLPTCVGKKFHEYFYAYCAVSTARICIEDAKHGRVGIKTMFKLLPSRGIESTYYDNHPFSIGTVKQVDGKLKYKTFYVPTENKVHYNE